MSRGDGEKYWKYRVQLLQVSVLPKANSFSSVQYVLLQLVCSHLS